MSKKEVNFELNLLPVISLLAVCISFLLLTAVWTQIGSLSVKQALGSESAEENKSNPPSLWINFENAGSLKLDLKDVEVHTKLKEVQIQSINSQLDLESLEEIALSLKQQVPELNTALLLPSPSTKYEDLIAVMDLFKKANITDLGIAPF